jgi:DNA invertase Pin-like site-specific DNA recombinase
LTIWRCRLGVGFGARELIRAHTGAGRERAKARGQSLGRPFKLTPHQRSAALCRRDRGEILTNIANSYNVHPSTISRLTA